jgi:hypothetical protein
MRLRRPLLAAAALLSALSTTTAQEPLPSFYSQELGINFTVQGGNNWCGRQIDLVLYASSREAYTKDPVGIQRSAGRVRGRLEQLCPSVRNITFEGRLGREVVYKAAASLIARWRLVEYDVATNGPICVGGDMRPAECEIRVQAFELGVALFDSDDTAGIQFTRMLDVNSRNHLEWNFRGSTGQLSILARETESAAIFADKSAQTFNDDCTKKGGKPDRQEVRSDGESLVMHLLICKSPSLEDRQYQLVRDDREQRIVMSANASGTNIEPARRLTEHVFKSPK